ncbi:unannotated protein [freshwater metagenome]|uniref:Unannotated protein n=1 Tax=freshwater metagenome TaxID=449393 RepID=A0A6J7HWG6_9ZZZZ
MATDSAPTQAGSLLGLMQDDYPLTIKYILDRARTVNGRATVASFDGEGLTRATYREVGDRVDRLCGALTTLGVQPGDRVATFMWNRQEHLEAYLGIPSMGAVLHTLNLRLFPEQLQYIVEHAQDRVVIIEDTLVPLLAPAVAELGIVEHFIVVGDGPVEGLTGQVHRYEELLAAAPESFAYPEIADDRTAAALCYTSGTTGNPKGVLYSHRSTVLHAVGECMADTFGICGRDTVLPVVPMFHANAWGLPYSSTLTGANLVMPGKFLQAEPLAKLITGERVTVAAGVPTIWLDLLRYADEYRPDLSSLRVVPCGGAAVPRVLLEGFRERHGLNVVQAWGMTETSPLGAVAHAPHDVDEAAAAEFRLRAGQVSPLVDVRIVDAEGEPMAWDGEASGEVEVRGPWIASRYYEDPTGDDKFHDGWLRTGDVASIDDRGYIRITDRSKDVIKSGGEWISSVDLENELMGHPDVLEAAVIAKPDERWTERPLACVVVRPGSDTDAEALAAYLSGRVAKWWEPDEYVLIPEVPKTSVGKFDKKALRARLESGELRGAAGDQS